MTEAALWNLQHGVEENPANEWTNYHNNNSDLDNYVLAKVKMNRLIIDKANYDRVVAAAGKDIAAAAEKELDELLKDFK